jgi:hypothetical protein
LTRKIDNLSYRYRILLMHASMIVKFKRNCICEMKRKLSTVILMSFIKKAFNHFNRFGKKYFNGSYSKYINSSRKM